MRVLIIEDEHHTQKYLSKLLKRVVPDVQVVDILDSVEDAVEWYNENSAPDLTLMDIQLADGLSFNIFKKVKVDSPVIFTTAFDQFTLQAFKVNSVDYLLKPIDEIELKNAIIKFQQVYGNNTAFNQSSLIRVINSLHQKENFRQRFLIKQGKDFIYLSTEEIAYLYSSDSLTFIVDIHNKRQILDSTLDSAEKELDPSDFFRISRRQIVHIQSIDKIFSYFNHRLKIKLKQESRVEAIVTRERVKEFKMWLNR